MEIGTGEDFMMAWITSDEGRVRRLRGEEVVEEGEGEVKSLVE